MENASKALIIAGSILLSILIIALGMYIFSTSSSTSDVTILSETEIQTYNAKFEKYKGEQLGSNVQALINALRSNATSNKGTSEKVPIINTNADVKFTTTSSKTNIQLTGPLTDETTIDGVKDKKLQFYISGLTDLSNNIQTSHRYKIKMDYNKDGLINAITINY